MQIGWSFSVQNLKYICVSDSIEYPDADAIKEAEPTKGEDGLSFRSLKSQKEDEGTFFSVTLTSR